MKNRRNRRCRNRNFCKDSCGEVTRLACYGDNMLNYPQTSNADYRDLFISHASEDKENFVRPLANALIAEAVQVWFDEFELQIGDSLRQKIDEGLRRSRYGLVVFSPTFFEKHWTQYEMDGLIARQMAGERVILPIWHRLTRDEIALQSPSLTDIISLNSSTDSVEVIASKVATVVKRSTPLRPSPQPATQSSAVDRAFGVFYVAPSDTEEPPPGPIEKDSMGWFHNTEGWKSMVASDQELEYLIQGQTLRVRLDWGNSLSGDEISAQQLINNGQPFALTIRSSDGHQRYITSVENTTPGGNWLGRSNPSGWMVFNIR